MRWPWVFACTTKAISRFAEATDSSMVKMSSGKLRFTMSDESIGISSRDEAEQNNLHLCLVSQDHKFLNGKSPELT